MNRWFFSEDEMDSLIDWVIRMAKFWSISGLAYVTIFYQSTLAGWVLGSLVALYAWDKYVEKKNEDNGRKTAK
jgi:hypothetical protein